MSDDDGIIGDGDFSTTVTILCECGEFIDGKEVVLRECPHRNGTRIEYCPKCDTELGITAGPLSLSPSGDGLPDCTCWS